ncbi:MAG TPA: hypothetical protein VFL55_03180 [Acetobacteraceae bacterium]|nr:hypothetical protein [Acetobacteraceae bacterium]
MTRDESCCRKELARTQGVRRLLSLGLPPRSASPTPFLDAMRGEQPQPARWPRLAFAALASIIFADAVWLLFSWR